VRSIHWSAAPPGATPTQRDNFIKVQIDGVGIGLASAAAPFLPVFLTRLGATNFQVGLLTAMPAFTGLLLAIAVGNFLQSRRQVVPWYSLMRLLVVASYALTGIVPFIVPREQAVPAVLFIWAAATLPQTFVNVAFSVVMNAVAGPQGRYDLMSRRWTILGLTSSITVALVGLALDRINFPLNYQVVFMGLSLGGLLSYSFSSRIDLPDAVPPVRQPGLSLQARFKGYVNLIWREKAFVSFVAKRFVYLSAAAIAAPLFPLYFVRVLQASDAWIGAISTAQTAIVLIGYPFWSQQWRRRGARFVLLWTTLGLAIYPTLTAFTHRVELIVVYAALAGLFQAGLDLVFFDELMKTVPPEYSATFVSLAQSLQYVSTVASPLAGTFLADHIGIGGGLLVSAALRLIGFALFARSKAYRTA
jgi:Na+/melibiose symporter-like transporter